MTGYVCALMLEVVPLGGVGEFGMNTLALTWGETTIVVDAGVMFPGPELFGVDLVIPDLSALDNYRGRIAALILTHGHEDHIGAVPHVLDRINGPILGSAFTLALVEPKLVEHGIDASDRFRAVKPRDTVEIGPFRVEFLRVTHSTPDCLAVALHTPAGVIVHTGDFKIDQTPIDGEHFDVHRFAQLGTEGVLALFADSTNIDRRGFTGSETEVVEAFEEIFTSTPGRLVVAAFASSVYRMQIKGPNKIGMKAQAPKHAGVMFLKAEEMGRPLEIAVAIGADPSLYLASQADVPLGVSEVEVAGALRGAPVEMVRCETVPRNGGNARDSGRPRSCLAARTFSMNRRGCWGSKTYVPVSSSIPTVCGFWVNIGQASTLVLAAEGCARSPASS